MRIKLLFLLPLFLASATLGRSESLPHPTLWEHNGSILYLVVNGSSRELYYQEPRQGMVEAGARPGSLLFHGKSVRGKYIGTAFIFNSRCGQYPYPVSGPILDSYDRVVLTGRAPRVAADCSVEGYFEDTLDFRLLKPQAMTPGTPVPPPPLNGSIPSGRIEVALRLDGGVLTVPVEINGAITLDFVLDSGAADVNVPADVVSTLIRTRTIRPSDFIGQQTYVLADGTEAPSPVFIIRSLKVGGRVVQKFKM
jgi:Aspartyl protease